MKRIFLLLFAAALAACGRYGAGVPAVYEPLLDAALAECPRADSLRALLRATPRAEREAMAYLLAWMPAGDRDTMRLDLLRENVEYACRARREFAWAARLPDSVFLNEVLPYAVVDEVRDSWRPDFYGRFRERVAGCTDLQSAAEAVNACVREVTGVDYNTAREKTNQSPSESMRQGMASCTGLSVLLVDALRSVGIPARFAGTAAWHDDRGNHSWTEVRFPDGEWRFTEFYYVGWDCAWFFADAGKATPGDRLHGIYAVSFRPTGDWFPMVWSERSRAVHGVDATPRYVGLYAAHAAELAARGTGVELSVDMFRDRAHDSGSADRVEANVDIFCDGDQVGGGRTAGPLKDMNDRLSLLVEKNRTYTLRYENARGEAVRMQVEVGDEPLVVKAYME
ncbi:transglutaminase family protein [Alistipes sp.]|uniref:transglutaminase-like domain-containing protein n=1 Tax=Alistipes sp. TaxID=1872444 RepID=UPI0011DDE186|nr:transglutaminase-like domain-containing protein [Alistipes sp.]